MRFMILIVGISMIFAGCKVQFGSKKGKEKSDSSYEIVKVERGEMKALVRVSGKIIPYREVAIKCKASGQVVELPFDVSDSVKEGDLLLSLDPVDEERRVNNAQVSLKISESRLEQAQLNLTIARKQLGKDTDLAESTLQSSQARLDQSYSSYLRQKDLLAKKMSSQEVFDQAHSSYIQAKAQRDSSQLRLEGLAIEEHRLKLREEEIKVAREEVAMKKIALEDARQSLSETRVLSPIDGVVTTLQVQAGTIISSGIQNVGGGTTILNLADLSKLYVKALVDESEIGKVRVGQKAYFSVDAFPFESFNGVVDRVAAKGSISSNVVVFEVTILVENPDQQKLKPEMSVDVRIEVLDEKSVLKVPYEAVLQEEIEPYVYVQDKSREEASRKFVKLGLNNGDYYLVRSGMQEGDEILVWKGVMDEEEGKDGKKRGIKLRVGK